MSTARSTGSVSTSTPGGAEKTPGAGMVSDRAMSPLGGKEITLPASPSTQQHSSMDGVTTTKIAPQNPFEKVTSPLPPSTVTSPAPMPVMEPSPFARTTGSDNATTPRSLATDAVHSPPPLSATSTSPDRKVMLSTPSSPAHSQIIPPGSIHLTHSPAPPKSVADSRMNSAPPQPMLNINYSTVVSPIAMNNTHPSIAPPVLQLHEPVDVQRTPQQPIFDDDENTEPSSAANTNDQNTEDAPGSFSRFIEHTRRRLGSGRNTPGGGPMDNDDTEVGGGEGTEDEYIVGGALIYGYLQKLGRNGKWQTRWFETDGECLSYYKNSKRLKLLATLDLEKVGLIEIDPNDDKGCLFTIQVLGRLYHLRAESRASCKDWVITLNRVKEARLQQGNVKLVNPEYVQQHDLLDHNDDFMSTRVVVVANRQRTRAVAESQDWDNLIGGHEPNHEPNTLNPQSLTYDVTKRCSTIGNVVLARWTKRKTSLSRLSAKFAKWARSLRKYSCTDAEDSVHLDRHVHPPGHDDKPKRRKDEIPLHPHPNHPPTVQGKPGKASRAMSAGSEDIRTIS